MSAQTQIAPAPVARERGRDERRAYRERGFRTHLRGAGIVRFDVRRMINATGRPAPGTLVGLLDRDGFCLRVGIVDAVRGRYVEVRVRRPARGTVARLQLGTLRVTASGEEVRG